MANRRKDRITPFEVMRPKPVAPETPVRAGEPANSPSEPETSAGDGASVSPETHEQSQPDPQTEPVVEESPLRPSATPGPIVLRIPQGYAAIIILGLVGILILAYWVGYRRGDQARRQLIHEQQEAAILLQERLISSGDTSTSVFESDQTGQQNASAGSPKTPQTKDEKRVAGQNYFILVHYHEAEAQRLVAFLKAHGVEAAAISSNNGRLFKVAALRGFEADELNSDGRRKYETRLRQLGRAWKKTRAGAGDLADMYLERYDGK